MFNFDEVVYPFLEVFLVAGNLVPHLKNHGLIQGHEDLHWFSSSFNILAL